MQNKTLMMKLISVILVLMLSLSNFLVLVSYAAEISFESKVDLASQDSKTNNKNIEFDSYFVNENNKTYTAKFNMEDANKVYLNLKLLNAGYLKTGVLKFEDSSFRIKEQEETASTIQDIDYDKNEISLNQINGGTEVVLEIPIEIAKSEIYDVRNLNKNNKVVFNGIYVTQKGKEVEIEKDIFLNLQWEAATEGILEQAISKYAKFDNKTIVEVKLNSSLNQNSMPIAETNIEFEVPELEEKKPIYVSAISNSLLATTGEKDGLSFGTNNFEYVEEENELKINVKNLANSESQVAWKNGLDEYKIILVYEDLSNEENKLTLNSKVSFDVYGKVDKVEKTSSTEVILNEQIGDINELEISTDTENIYKSFMYANSEYETEYSQNWNLKIGYAGVSDKIVVSNVNETFINEKQEKTAVNKNTYYKQTIINRSNFEKILGQDGFIKILNEQGEEIGNITLASTEDENIIINYQNSDLSKIKIQTSKPQIEGTIQIKHIKAIKAQTDFEKDLIKTFNSLENEINLNTIYNKVTKIPSLEEGQEETVQTEELEVTNLNVLNNINLLEPQTKIELNTNKESLVTGSVNEDVEIYVSLINNKVEYALFNNSVIDIKLPKEIEYIKLKDAKLIFEEELSIANKELYEAEDGTKHIKITLGGNQTKYNIENIITGANLTIIADIGLNEIEETIGAEIEAICINEDTEAIAKTNINLIKVEIPEPEPEPESQPEQTPEQEQEEQTPEHEQEQMPEQEEPKQEENENPSEEQEENTEEKNNLSVMVNVESDKEENGALKWGEIVTYKITIKNYGSTLKNSNLIIDLPEGLNYMEEEQGTFDPIFYEENTQVRIINWNLEEMLTGREISKEFKAIVNREASNVSLRARVVDNESGKYALSNELKNECKKANVSIQLATRTYTEQIGQQDTFDYEIKIKELLGNRLSNVVLELDIPNGINYNAGYLLENNNIVTGDIKNQDGKVIINLPELLENEEKYIVIELIANNINEISDKDITAKVKANADGMEECISNEVKNELTKPMLEVKHYSNLQNKDENIITHFVEVKNVGVGTAYNLEIEDNYLGDINYISTTYFQNGEIKELNNYAGKKTRIITSLEENETVIMAVSTKVLGESNVENFAKVSARGIETITTDTAKYTVIGNEENSNSSSNNNNNSNNQNNDEEVKKSGVAGLVWIDNNRNGIKESDESKLQSIDTYLINKETNSQINVKTNSNGEYKFENIENGRYMLVFVYDTSKYSLTKSFVEYINQDLISKGVRAEAQINGDTKVVAIIEEINVQDGDISNLNIGLVENEIFDLSLNKVVENITVKTKKGTINQDANKKLAKVEIHAKEIEGAEVKITYRFDVKNEGDIEGTATKILENMPEELSINLEENPGWKVDEKGKLYNDSLSGVTINPGETKSIYLVLEKVMTEDNTGIINNIAEIAEEYNAMNKKDNDSIPGNSKQNEDDLSSADVYIGIKTGKALLYTSLALSMFIVLSTGIYLINKKVLQK